MRTWFNINMQLTHLITQKDLQEKLVIQCHKWKEKDLDEQFANTMFPTSGPCHAFKFLELNGLTLGLNVFQSNVSKFIETHLATDLKLTQPMTTNELVKHDVLTGNLNDLLCTRVIEGNGKSKSRSAPNIKTLLLL